MNYKKWNAFSVQQEVSKNMGAQGAMDMKMKIDMAVTARDCETITEVSKITSISMNMLQDGQAMSYDSSLKKEDLDEMGKMRSQQLAPMLTASIIIKTSTQGNVLGSKVAPVSPAMN